MTKKYYAIKLVESEREVQTPIGYAKLKLQWADGMCGVIPIFTNKKKAQKYAGKQGIIEFVEVKE